MLCRACLILMTVVLTSPALARAQDQGGADLFETKIRPVLVNNCFKCHSGKKVKADLWLDSRAAMLKGTDNGPAIVPGHPDKGLLIKAIRYENKDVRMPPAGKLPDAVIADFTEWIKRGAPWPDESKGTAAVKPKEFDLKERAKHWSLQPLTHPAPPRFKDAAWPITDIDGFIYHGLVASGVSPAAGADRRTLIRRVTFDLTGLPPTKAEIDAFLADPAPDAFAKVVDRLLASPRYAEHWARHWLDLVRFAETHGHEFDFPIPEAWRYRDYVIRALDADLPYDKFVTEHIAGDLLSEPRRHPVEKFNESIIGTGF